jgi:hypothetical protein
MGMDIPGKKLNKIDFHNLIQGLTRALGVGQGKG